MTILERNDTNGVAHLNMNAPERLNALSDEMLAALQSQFDAIKKGCISACRDPVGVR